MSESRSGGVQTFQAALATAGWSHQVTELPQTTRTAAEAAAAVGCQVAQIAKSLIFRNTVSAQPILVVASGANRVDERRLAELVGHPIGKADADFVRAQTGYAIGGVPPVGHRQAIPTYIDKSLLDQPEIWAAAGSPFAVFRLTPEDLVAMTGGQVVAIATVTRAP